MRTRPMRSLLAAATIALICSAASPAARAQSESEGSGSARATFERIELTDLLRRVSGAPSKQFLTSG